MRARQEAVERTRLRITEAAMALHERVGPAATTVSAVAEEAGVTRLTVYRHFPDEVALIAACSTHWSQSHPQPDLATWKAIADPVERLRTALAQTFTWWCAAAPMMSKIHRDLESLPSFVGASLAADRQERVAVLCAGFGARGRARIRLKAAISLALALTTWQALCVDGGLRDEEAVELLVAAVTSATG